MPVASYPLDEIWPVVLPRITGLIRRYARVCDWTEDDVYRACAEKRAFLFNSSEDGSFAVVKLKERNGAKILFVWIACGENGKRLENLALLREIAHHVGASRMEMESPRRGFDRMPGWQRGMTTYSMEV